ncbi:MAG: asparagine synthase-related protein [Candidatus Micrarchaeota archaeon]|nr:asparagine synthase-related protein [Candidatus Micrarchaeota archaeon]
MSSIFGISDGEGSNMLRVNGEELQLPPNSDEGFLSFNGWFYKSPADEEELIQLIEKKGIGESVRMLEGDYALCYYKKGSFKLARDPVGARALFYGENNEVFAFSSSRELLQKLGVGVISLKPGSMLSYEEGRIKLVQCNSLPQPAFSSEFTGSVKRKLEEALIHSVEKRMLGIGKIGIMFSGGIDSTLIAHVAKKFNSELFLYSVGTEESEDMKYISKFSEELGLEAKQIILEEDELLSYYGKVQGLLYDKGFMKVELAIPIFICSEHARRDGVRVMLTGSGAEELFAGYDRHLQCFLSGGDLRRMLRDELRALHSKDLENGEYAASLNQCELRYPFLDLGVIEAATLVKPELNLSRRGEKKRVLKAVSREMGLLEDAVERPKKAMQYGSGMHKLLIRARRKNLIK